ncbi:MAG TPA: PIN domain-containing protein [Solirubrobacteraceae bacterium]|nr:PIN domain-containing protein [Solirubrobacteraceae bacterium]
MIVVDTSVILAYMNSADEHHEPVRAWLLQADDDLVTTPLIVAEADHLVAARGGWAAASALRVDLAAGAYVVDWWPQAITTAVRVADRYADMPLGLADASLVALAERHGTVSVATLDERHFRAVRPLAGGAAFRLLPADT